MAATEIRPGLWRWSAPHPDWHEDALPGSSGDWPREVGCALWEGPGAAVFIDALVPAGEEPSFWDWADRRCDGKAVWALSTIAFHRRSREAVRERYGACTSRARRQLPAGVHSVPLKGAGETMFWLPEQRAVVPGDRLIGGPGGRLSLCPQSWLEYLPGALSTERLRLMLVPLLALEIEFVLVSHGEPVLSDGGAALERALA